MPFTTELELHVQLIKIHLHISNSRADARGLSAEGVRATQTARERTYATLEPLTRHTHPFEPSRFAKLLLRLPALRALALKCRESQFFSYLFSFPPVTVKKEDMNNGNPPNGTHAPVVSDLNVMDRIEELLRQAHGSNGLQSAGLLSDSSGPEHATDQLGRAGDGYSETPRKLMRLSQPGPTHSDNAFSFNTVPYDTQNAHPPSTTN